MKKYFLPLIISIVLGIIVSGIFGLLKASPYTAGFWTATISQITYWSLRNHYHNITN